MIISVLKSEFVVTPQKNKSNIPFPPETYIFIPDTKKHDWLHFSKSYSNASLSLNSGKFISIKT